MNSFRWAATLMIVVYGGTAVAETAPAPAPGTPVPAPAEPTAPSVPSPAAAAASTGSPLPRVAVAQIGDLQVAKTLGELGPDVVVKAAAQGVRDACLDVSIGRFREPAACARPAMNVPEGVCADLTLERALAPFAACTSDDRAPVVVELGSSPCRTTECLRADAKAAGATHLLVVQGRSTEFGLDVAADLVDLASGESSSKRYRDYFPANARSDAEIVPRTGPQTLGILHGMARDLVQVALIEKLAPPVPHPTPPPPPPPAAPEWFAWTLVGTGTAAVLAGMGLWLLDGRRKGCEDMGEVLCPTSWDTQKIGIPMVIVGAMAATGGAIVLWRRPDGTDVRATPAPGGLAFVGRF